jgi:hypothetical protein
MPDIDKPNGLRPFLEAVRRREDEGQLTQILAAFAGSDPRFAADFVRILVAAAPRPEARDRLGPIPHELVCQPEQNLRDRLGKDKGYIDLRFDDRSSGFTLLVELKLGSEYGADQLERYADALDALPPGRTALLAVTRTMPQVGEEAVEANPAWLGSVRWSHVFTQLRQLSHADPQMAPAWPQLMDLIKDQADFGPVDIDATAVEAWARLEQGEQLVRWLLTNVAKPALAVIREEIGSAPDDKTAAQLQMYGSTTPIWAWKGRWHLRYAVPADVGKEHRLRLQIFARDGRPTFTVEARYDHPTEVLATLPQGRQVEKASKALEDAGFEVGKDREGYYWAAVEPPEEWLYAGAQITERMLDLVRRHTRTLAASEIWSALPTAAASAEQTAPDESPDHVAGGATPGSAASDSAALEASG